MTDTAHHSPPIDDAAREHASDAAKDAAKDAAMTRLAVRMALGGFAMMFVAGAFMWMNFGPTIFVDLATAVVNCF